MPLEAHIVDLHIAEISYLKSFFKCKSGIVGVNVYLYDILIIKDNSTVSYGFKIGPEVCCLFGSVLAVDDVFRAVGVDDLLIILEFDVVFAPGRLICIRRDGPGITLEGSEHLLDYHNEALCACIHNTCLFEYGELFGGISQCFLGSTYHFRPLDDDIIGVEYHLAGFFGCHP